MIGGITNGITNGVEANNSLKIKSLTDVVSQLTDALLMAEKHNEEIKEKQQQLEDIQQQMVEQIQQQQQFYESKLKDKDAQMAKLQAKNKNLEQVNDVKMLVKGDRIEKDSKSHSKSRGRQLNHPKIHRRDFSPDDQAMPSTRVTHPTNSTPSTTANPKSGDLSYDIRMYPRSKIGNKAAYFTDKTTSVMRSTSSMRHHDSIIHDKHSRSMSGDHWSFRNAQEQQLREERASRSGRNQRRCKNRGGRNHQGREGNSDWKHDSYDDTTMDRTRHDFGHK